MDAYTKLRGTYDNELNREKARVAPIEDTMKEARLKLFDHIKERDINTLVWICKQINLLDCKMGNGISKEN